MGVPAFYRWLSDKYPKIVEHVLEERVHLLHESSTRPSYFDCTRPNPSGLECDNLYIDMNGIIHPCSHPENGPQPKSEQEMYDNVCQYVDRLFRAVRPRKMLYLAIDGVAPRAKMNQQRSRRFRSAQEARELEEVENEVRDSLIKAGHPLEDKVKANSCNGNGTWDSNVITPGTTFMLELSEYVRFYIRKRLSTDPAWKSLTVLFSDASIPGEGEHKIMSHVRLQRTHPSYDPNLVHVLHGLDADLIMLALATHEAHFYILREEVVFGRRGAEMNARKKQETGFTDEQNRLDALAGSTAMTILKENSQYKPLKRISIPILREYLHFEFSSCHSRAHLPSFPIINFERLIDDIVFLCFFVGNDFLPHLPSLDIRDGALDFLFNVYKRVLPTLGDYITNHGGEVNLSHVDVILAEVGAIEDFVFNMKHTNEQNEKKSRENYQKNKQLLTRDGQAPLPHHHPTKNNNVNTPKYNVMGRAAKVLAQDNNHGHANAIPSSSTTTTTISSSTHTTNTTTIRNTTQSDPRKSRNQTSTINIKPTVKSMTQEQNSRAAMELKALLDNNNHTNHNKNDNQNDDNDNNNNNDNDNSSPKVETKKRSITDMENKQEQNEDNDTNKKNIRPKVEQDNDYKDMFDDDDDENGNVENNNNKGKDGDDELNNNKEEDNNESDIVDDSEEPNETDMEDAKDAAKIEFKKKVKETQQKKLDEHAKTVIDKVRLHENGWKDRYYTDKCKAEDVSENGGKEHLFRSYIMGLCWVMKYYYDGCPSWKWYYPFHYAPFASDLKNIERFEKDCKSFELNEPFAPIEQLMAVLPNDSSHAIPKAARWLMSDPESPILDFYPTEILCDPNGKAMPWLWVVLLPFIDETRLLEAMKPTMKEWTEKELLANARGLDDGYIYVHVTHPLAAAVLPVLESTDKNKKLSIKSLTSDDDGKKIDGLLRPPLSNEIYPIDEATSINPPSSAAKIAQHGYENVFSEAIDPNAALCVAFTEPEKKTHQSHILPGALPPSPTLVDKDLVIRRPRLNRGGGTIANMGMGAGTPGQSHQVGYGSMNISSYERNLAHKMGHGNQMNQPGTRAWGAMEPSHKKSRHNQGMAGNYQHFQHNQPQYQQRAPHAGGNGGYLQQGHVPSFQWQQQHQTHQIPPPSIPPPPYYQGGVYQQQQQNQNMPRHQNPNTFRGHQQNKWSTQQTNNQQLPQPQVPHQATSFSFANRNQNNSRPQYSNNTSVQQSYNHPNRGGGQQQVQNNTSRINPNVIKNLRSQLANTLQQNRRGGS